MNCNEYSVKIRIVCQCVQTVKQELCEIPGNRMKQGLVYRIVRDVSLSPVFRSH